MKTYGPPEEFGYKEFIPLFTAEHHDGFSMWDAWVLKIERKRPF